ncbi:MAG TPA: acyltransferase family protein [Coriobacteriia bacterium]
MTASPAPSRSRQPDIEGLRALAAIMVVVAHLPWYQYFPGGVWLSAPRWLAYRAPLLGIGGLAVVIFLVISGAGLCRLLVLKSPPLGGYLRTRMGRLFGVFWAAAVPISIGAFVTGWQPIAQLGNVALVLLGLGFVSKASWAALFPSWWYIAIAWQVVLVAPLMVWGMRRLRPWGLLAVTAGIVIAGCYLVPLLGMHYDGEKSLIVGRALEVAGGAFLALELWPEVRERLGVGRGHAAGLVLATVAILAGMYFTGLGGRWLYRAAGLALTAAVVYARPLERLGHARPAALAVAAGGASFAVYILHEPIMLLVRRASGAPDHISLLALGALSLVVVVPVAVLFDRAIGVVQARASARAKANAKGGAA